MGRSQAGCQSAGAGIGFDFLILDSKGRRQAVGDQNEAVRLGWTHDRFLCFAYTAK